MLSLYLNHVYNCTKLRSESPSPSESSGGRRSDENSRPLLRVYQKLFND